MHHVGQGLQHFLLCAQRNIGFHEALLSSTVCSRHPPGQIKLQQPVRVALIALAPAGMHGEDYIHGLVLFMLLRPVKLGPKQGPRACRRASGRVVS